MNEYEGKITEFFQGYLHFPKFYYTESGNLTDVAVRTAAILLLKEHVFDSIADMREQAMKDCNVILPESIFEKE